MLEKIPFDKIQNIKNPQTRKRYLKYYKLPPELRQLMFSPSTAQKIQTISENHNLSSEQAWYVSHIIGMIVLGEINIHNFLKAIQEKCDIETNKAKELAKDINQELFLPAKEQLKKIHNVNRWPREEETTEKENQKNGQTQPRNTETSALPKEENKDENERIVNLRENNE